MAIHIDPQNFNPSALVTPGLYLEVIPPQAYIPGAPASVSGFTGTASWGPLNQPQLVGNFIGSNSIFGPMSAAALTDPFDLATEIYNALNQTSQASGLALWCVRVADNTAAAADVVLESVSQLTNITFGGTITNSDVISLTFTAAGIAGSPLAVTYTVNTSVDTSLTLLATHIAAALNASSPLSNAGITATSSGAHVLVEALGPTVYPAITNSSGGGISETISIASEAPLAGGTLAGLYTGVLGNQIVCTISAGSNANKVNVLLTAWSGKSQEFYQGLPNSAAFWVALQNALAQGTGPTQGPSSLCTLTPSGAEDPGAPALGSFTLSGGLDGRSGVTKAQLVGTNDTVPPTGLYTLLNLQPAVNQAWCVGLTDSTAWSEIDQFGQQNGIAVLLFFPINTSITTAITDLNTAGILDYQAIPILDWVLFFDPNNNVQRYVAPGGHAGGNISALSPEQSPLNKQITGVLATPRTASGSPYSNAELGQANSTGITLISNPIPLGPTFGFATAVNRSANATQTPIEYTRMTNFLINSVGAVLGQYVGDLQSTSPSDPTRAAIRNSLNTFFNNLVGNHQLDGYQVICDVGPNAGNGINTPAQIAQHICNVYVAARYLASIWYLIFALQGGTTVSVSTPVISPQPTGS